MDEYRGALANDTPEDEPEDDPVERAPARVALCRENIEPKLFDYQSDLAQQVIECCTSSPPDKTALLALPTGAGKTRTALWGLLKLMEQGHAQRVLWLAPTKELLSQGYDAARDLWHNFGSAIDMELVRADVLRTFPRDVKCGFFFATPQMLVARIRRHRPLPDAQVLVFDEAHHLEAPTFKEALQSLTAATELAIIGLSATPGRRSQEETERLVDFFGGRLLRSTRLRPNAVTVLQRRGVLARVQFRDIPTRTQLQGGSLSAERLAANQNRFTALIDLLRRIPRAENTLVFSASVSHGHAIEVVLERSGIPARVVSGYMTDSERERTLNSFEKGELSVLINKSLLATGYDCPAVQNVVLTVPIRSAIQFEQIIGRASRGPAMGGNAIATVWQFEDHLSLHGLPASYHRYEDFDWKPVR